MNRTTTLRFSAFLMLVCQILSTSSPSFARGGGHAWYDPDEFKTIRDANAWNGDSYMSDYDKSCLYKNSKMHNVVGNTSVWDGNGGAANQGATMANYGGTGENYSGPAYIGPTNYSSVVQTYQWSSTPVNNSVGKIHPKAFTNGSIETARRLGH